MPGTPGERQESLDVIQRELTAFARRARAAAARLHPELPLVSYTLLAHIDDRHGCRATDLAAHYMLDKSTVSRQIGALEKLGLVERHPDPNDHRIQVLHPTEAGTQALASTQASRRSAYQERLADWTADDLAGFAEYLLRYNAAGDTSTTSPQTPKA
ncbi:MULTISPECIES: MarR family winged helix-turn-helix transcriptional regulator [Streptomyces]|uniref:MarR family transcriptional regulator n=1 Tax=Streptomyces atratus TaxID=1893 RepID=A0A2Z5JEY0_STRAR|nr:MULTISPECIES: MarR family winged helix-turn-helix transcriptional regulator [Streptomyces]AXE78928.1 MarR family transcriptional regulator [Streptomyces atratus]MEE1813168.1 MarR family winged helix-turn-helix transcriptional regulator [Streptomyces sp. BE133]WPW29990.1 MarR family winged helix-turn-helix transcriptional regulator [Streptomyces atratus]GGT25499.1 MarR family transcriptional regulator [Streptomyces atratus]